MRETYSEVWWGGETEPLRNTMGIEHESQWSTRLQRPLCVRSIKLVRGAAGERSRTPVEFQHVTMRPEAVNPSRLISAKQLEEDETVLITQRWESPVAHRTES